MKLDFSAVVKRKPAKSVVAAKAVVAVKVKAAKASKAKSSKTETTPVEAAAFGFPPPANRRHKTTVTRVVPRKASRKAAKTRVATGKGR